MRAQLAQAQAAAALSATELKRQQDLVAKGFVSRQVLDAGPDRASSATRRTSTS